MKIDIQKCSIQFLKNILAPLDTHTNHVFWIRNHENSKQFYTSPNYEKIWERQADLLFEIPLIWLDYLAVENKALYMKQLQDRHVHNYQNYEKNLVFYEIGSPSKQTRFLKDRCFRCRDTLGNDYLVGISQLIPVEEWHKQYKAPSRIIDTSENNIYKEFFYLLKKNFGFALIKPLNDKNLFLNQYQEFLLQDLRFNFTRRELECLHYCCQGKTYKQIALAMTISPRTVETHLENVLRKTSCNNKIELISRFSKYFDDAGLTLKNF